jgi:hypothetical protein
MKGRPSTLTILLGFVGLIIAIGLILGFAMNYLAKMVDPYVLGSATLIILAFIGIFEWRQKIKQKQKDKDFLSIAKTIRPTFKTEIDSFFKSFKDGTKPIDLFYNFMEDKNQVLTVDWRGEENEGEIETFIESLNQEQIEWTKVNELIEGQLKRKVSDDKFIIKLFKSIDMDLQNINTRLLFLNIDGDSYVFTTVDTETYKKVLDNLGKEFYGVDKL